MPELTKELVKKIEATHDRVTVIATILGNGRSGLVHDSRQHNKRIWRIEIFLALLAGSGIITGGTLAFIRFVVA